MFNLGKRIVNDDGRVKYEITEHDLRLAMHSDDLGFIFDVEWDSWNRHLTVYMSPEMKGPES